MTQRASLCFIVTGERRTGKTSFLYALRDGRLGKQVLPMFIDIQGLTGRSVAGFFRSLSQEILNALHLNMELSRERFQEDAFDEFALVLDEVEKKRSDQHMLLMIDEFEALQLQIDKKRWPVEILDIFRSLIQHREGFSLMFCGTYNKNVLTLFRETC